MIKAGILLFSMLLVSTASAEIFEFDNNFIDYGPAPSISLPYPYHAVEQVPPVYKSHRPKVILPSPTEVVELIEPAGFISTAISCTFDVIKSVVVYFITRIPGLVAGIIAALGICKLTSLCDTQITIYEAETELRSLATPERLSLAVEFVKEALSKYNEMQNS